MASASTAAVRASCTSTSCWAPVAAASSELCRDARALHADRRRTARTRWSPPSRRGGTLPASIVATTTLALGWARPELRGRCSSATRSPVALLLVPPRCDRTISPDGAPVPASVLVAISLVPVPPLVTPNRPTSRICSCAACCRMSNERTKTVCWFVIDAGRRAISANEGRMNRGGWSGLAAPTDEGDDEQSSRATAGWMLWFMRKTLVGSYFALRAASRS